MAGRLSGTCASKLQACCTAAAGRSPQPGGPPQHDKPVQLPSQLRADGESWHAQLRLDVVNLPFPLI